MEEKKTTRTRNGTRNGNGEGWGGYILDMFFGSVQTFVDGVLGSIDHTLHLVVRRISRGAFLFFFSVIGIVFLLIGFARLLSTMLRFPGAGETLMGIFILLICLVYYAFTRDER